MTPVVKYSIILPVRNGGEYVKGCVNSILAQSFTGFQLQVLDNCSSDGTVEWINSLKDPRIEIFQSEKPLSIEENWSRIKTIKKNEFITLIGHDDVLDHNYLEVMNDLIARHPMASLYQTHFRYIDYRGRIIRRCKPMDEIQTASEFLGSFLSSTIDTMGTGFMMRGADYDAYGGIPTYPNLLFADFELWISLSGRSYKATSSKECFSFRLHKSMTTVSPDLKFQKAFEQFIKYLVRLKDGNTDYADIIEKYAVSFIKFYCRGLSHRLLRTPKRNREGQSVTDFLKNCKAYADMLVPDNDFDPNKIFSVRLAKQIDSNFFTRSLFLLFKRIFPRPILL